MYIYKNSILNGGCIKKISYGWSLKISTYHLLEQNIMMFQRFGQHHRLLVMYIVIQGPMNQQILFIPNLLSNSGQRWIDISLQIVLWRR